MENAKVKGAVSVTLLALGGLAGVAVSSGAGGSGSEPAAALKPKIRTEVVRKTIHRTRTADSPGAGAAPAAYATVPASTYVAPATSQPAAAVSSSSGSGSGGGSGGGYGGYGGGNSGGNSGGSYEAEDGNEVSAGYEPDDSYDGYEAADHESENEGGHDD
jgi:hypothetical protein